MASIFPAGKLALERLACAAAGTRCSPWALWRLAASRSARTSRNTYWEDRNEKHGQHRWVQYKNTGLRCQDGAAVVARLALPHDGRAGPELCSFFEDKLKPVAQLIRMTTGPILRILGRSPYKEEEHLMTNETQLRNRGYGIGSMLKPDPNEPDKYYKQPGSETSGQAGEYARRKTDMAPCTRPTRPVRHGQDGRAVGVRCRNRDTCSPICAFDGVFGSSIAGRRGLRCSREGGARFERGCARLSRDP